MTCLQPTEASTRSPLWMALCVIVNTLNSGYNVLLCICVDPLYVQSVLSFCFDDSEHVSACDL